MNNKNNTAEQKLYLQPKFLTSLGASSIMTINPPNFLSQEIPGYEAENNPFENSYFFYKNHNPLNSSSQNEIQPNKIDKYNIKFPQQNPSVQTKIKENSILNRSDLAPKSPDRAPAKGEISPPRDRIISPQRSDISSTNIDINTARTTDFEAIKDEEKFSPSDSAKNPIQTKLIQNFSREDLATEEHPKNYSKEALEAVKNSNISKFSSGNLPVQKQSKQNNLQEDLGTDVKYETAIAADLNRKESRDLPDLEQEQSIKINIIEDLMTADRHEARISENLQKNELNSAKLNLNSVPISKQQKSIQTRTDRNSSGELVQIKSAENISPNLQNDPPKLSSNPDFQDKPVQNKSDSLQIDRKNTNSPSETKDPVKLHLTSSQARQKKLIQTSSFNDLTTKYFTKNNNSENLNKNELKNIYYTNRSVEKILPNTELKSKNIEPLITEISSKTKNKDVLKQTEAIDTPKLTSQPFTVQHKLIQAKKNKNHQISNREASNQNKSIDVSKSSSDKFSAQSLQANKTEDLENNTEGKDRISEISKQLTATSYIQEKSIQTNSNKDSITDDLKHNLSSHISRFNADYIVQQKPIQTRIKERNSEVLSGNKSNDRTSNEQNLVQTKIDDYSKTDEKRENPNTNNLNQNESTDTSQSNYTYAIERKQPIKAKIDKNLSTEADNLLDKDTAPAKLDSTSVNIQKEVIQSSSFADLANNNLDIPATENELNKITTLNSDLLLPEQKKVQTTIDRLASDCHSVKEKPIQTSSSNDSVTYEAGENKVTSLNKSWDRTKAIDETTNRDREDINTPNENQNPSIQTKEINNLSGDREKENTNIPSLKKNTNKNSNLTFIPSSSQEQPIQNNNLTTEDKPIATNTENRYNVRSNLNTSNNDGQNIIQKSSIDDRSTKEKSIILEREEKESDYTLTTLLNSQTPIIQQLSTQNNPKESLADEDNSLEQNLIQTKARDLHSRSRQGLLLSITNNTNSKPQITDTVRSQIQASPAELSTTGDLLSSSNKDATKESDRENKPISKHNSFLHSEGKPIQTLSPDDLLSRKEEQQNTQSNPNKATNKAANTSEGIAIQTPEDRTKQTTQTSSSNKLETDEQILTSSKDNLDREELNDISVLNPLKLQDNSDPLPIQEKSIQNLSSEKLVTDNQLAKDSVNIARKKEEINRLLLQQKSIPIISSKQLETDNELNHEPFISQREPIQTKIDRNLANESDKQSSERNSASKDKIETNFSNIDSSLDNSSKPIQTFSKNFELKMTNRTEQSSDLAKAKSHSLDNLSENTQDLSKQFDNNENHRSKKVQNLSKKSEDRLRPKTHSLEQNESDNLSTEEVENIPENWSNIEELLAKSSPPDLPKNAPSMRQRSITVQPLLQSKNLTYENELSELDFTINRNVSNDRRVESENKIIQTEQINDETAEDLETYESSERSLNIDSHEEENDGNDDDLEVLAREIYWSIRQRIEIEQERQGNYYSGTSGW
ncbi:MAG: hypothetical protein QNJ38_21790 [Prochloraceae cyanobacterium]|nr:hypothetical protein [Prochloraceae cyanobacterium]